MMLKYKDYVANVEMDAEENLLHGRVLGIRDIVTFEGQTPAEVVKAFRDSVDDYLAFCASRNEEPNKPFSGKLLLRLNPTLHRMITAFAEASGVSLNTWISTRLEQDVSGTPCASREQLDRMFGTTADRRWAAHTDTVSAALSSKKQKSKAVKRKPRRGSTARREADAK